MRLIQSDLRPQAISGSSTPGSIHRRGEIVSNAVLVREQVYQIGSIQAALCLEVALREHRLHKMNHNTIGDPQARGHSRRCLQPHNARLRANQGAKRHKRRYPSLKTSEDSPSCLNRASESGSTGRGRARQWRAIEARRDRREHRLTMLVLAITRHAFQGLS